MLRILEILVDLVGLGRGHDGSGGGSEGSCSPN